MASITYVQVDCSVVANLVQVFLELWLAPTFVCMYICNTEFESGSNPSILNARQNYSHRYIHDSLQCLALNLGANPAPLHLQLKHRHCSDFLVLGTLFSGQFLKPFFAPTYVKVKA
jgi:hypothetical protein